MSFFVLPNLFSSYLIKIFKDVPVYECILINIMKMVDSSFYFDNTLLINVDKENQSTRPSLFYITITTHYIFEKIPKVNFKYFTCMSMYQTTIMKFQVKQKYNVNMMWL